MRNNILYNGLYMQYCTHLPSNQKFRSKPEVVKFILYEAPPKSNTRKRKSDELGTECEVQYD
jgi:hypothetical protein